MGSTFDLGQGVEALPGEAFGEEGQEVGDGGMAGELVVGGVQEPFDGFGVERAVEVASEPGGGMVAGKWAVKLSAIARARVARSDDAEALPDFPGSARPS